MECQKSTSFLTLSPSWTANVPTAITLAAPESPSMVDDHQTSVSLHGNKESAKTTKSGKLIR
jgi:hypothetical protein